MPAGKLALLAAVIFAPLTVIAHAPAEAQQAYEGQISGTFHGWDGETVYKLMDGHIIQQSEYHYHYHYTYAPNIIIYQSNGGYKIHVEDDDDEDIGIRVLR